MTRATRSAAPCWREGAGHRPLLICYFPIGDPFLGIDLIDIYSECGVDVVELGLPTTNPYLDGADVRDSMARAGTTDCLAALSETLARLRQRPVAANALLMTYARPQHPMLARPEAWSGVDGLQVVAPVADPVRHQLETEATRAGVDVSTFVPLPLTAEDTEAARRATGYVMLQAAAGVTGPRDELDPANRDRIAQLRHGGVAASIVLGFGISNGSQAAAAREAGADGIVVGSRCLRAALEGPVALQRLLTDLREGLDG